MSCAPFPDTELASAPRFALVRGKWTYFAKVAPRKPPPRHALFELNCSQPALLPRSCLDSIHNHRPGAVSLLRGRFDLGQALYPDRRYRGLD